MLWNLNSAYYCRPVIAIVFATPTSPSLIRNVQFLHDFFLFANEKAFTIRLYNEMPRTLYYFITVRLDRMRRDGERAKEAEGCDKIEGREKQNAMYLWIEFQIDGKLITICALASYISKI